MFDNSNYIKAFSCSERDIAHNRWKASGSTDIEKTLGNLQMQLQYLHTLSIPSTHFALAVKFAIKANNIFWRSFELTRSELIEQLNFQEDLSSFRRYLNNLEDLKLIERIGKRPYPIKYFVVPYVTKEYFDKTDFGLGLEEIFANVVTIKKSF